MASSTVRLSPLFGLVTKPTAFLPQRIARSALFVAKPASVSFSTSVSTPFLSRTLTTFRISTSNFSTVRTFGAGLRSFHAGTPALEEAHGVYVGGLPYTIDDEALQAQFEPIGKIISARVVTDPTGRSQGFGFVHFEDAESAKSAIDQMNDIQLDGRYLKVSFAKVREPRRTEVRTSPTNPPSKRVWVSNLDYNLSDQTIRQGFLKFGTITDVTLPQDQRTGGHKGFAFIEFEDQESAEKLMEQYGPGKEPLIIGERELRLDFSGPKPERRTSGDSRGEGRDFRGGNRREGGYRGGNRDGGGSNRGDRDSRGVRGGRRSDKQGGEDSEGYY